MIMVILLHVFFSPNYCFFVSQSGINGADIVVKTHLYRKVIFALSLDIVSKWFLIDEDDHEKKIAPIVCGTWLSRTNYKWKCTKS